MWKSERLMFILVACVNHFVNMVELIYCEPYEEQDIHLDSVSKFVS